MALKKDKGFVLRSFDFRETSKIVHLFTQDHGKIHGLCKGIRTGKKEFFTPLNTFSLNEFIFYESRKELWLVSSADMIRDFGYLSQDVETNLIANFIVELTDKITPLHQPHPQVFSLIEKAFEHLKKGELKRKILYLFQIKILELSGFRPHLTACLKCADEIGAQAFFSVKLGGLLCDRCRPNDAFARELSGELLSGLKYVQNNELAVSLRLSLSNQTEKEVLEILEDFLSFHLDARIRSLSPASCLDR